MKHERMHDEALAGKEVAQLTRFPFFRGVHGTFRGMCILMVMAKVFLNVGTLGLLCPLCRKSLHVSNR